MGPDHDRGSPQTGSDTSASPVSRRRLLCVTGGSLVLLRDVALSIPNVRPDAVSVREWIFAGENDVPKWRLNKDWQTIPGKPVSGPEHVVDFVENTLQVAVELSTGTSFGPATCPSGSRLPPSAWAAGAKTVGSPMEQRSSTRVSRSARKHRLRVSKCDAWTTPTTTSSFSSGFSSADPDVAPPYPAQPAARTSRSPVRRRTGSHPFFRRPVLLIRAFGAAARR